MMEDKVDALTTWLRPVLTLMAVAGLITSGSGEANAQFEQKWLAAGDLHQAYLASGHEQELWRSSWQNGMRWPAVEPLSGHNRGNGLWIAAKNFTNPEGEEFPRKVVHVGPRSAGVGEFFSQEFELYNRFPMPKVTVDGLETFDVAQKPDEIRPDMKADQMLHTEVTTQLGLRMERNIYQFSQEYHDNYHIREYIITNTGNADDDAEKELDSSLEDVRVLFQKRPQMTEGAWAYYPGSAWGANIMNDMVNDGLGDYDVPFENFAEYRWAGNSPNADIDPLGGPVRESGAYFLQEGDTVGRLREQWFLGTVVLENTEPDQYPNSEHSGMEAHPTTSSHYSTDAPLTGASDPFNKSRMQREYKEMMALGHVKPHHADIVDQDDDFTTPDGNAKLGVLGGYKNMFGFGPYDLDVGESVRIVQAEGVDGMSRKHAYRIGKKWKETGWDPEAPITHTIGGETQTMTKSDWWYTGRDSLNQTFQRAIGAWDNDMEVPSPPMPPKSFAVTSGVDAIELSWTTFAGSEEQGFEIYRSKNHVEGNLNNEFEYRKIADVGAGAGTYRDEAVTRGSNYYYYIQAVGPDRPANASTMTPGGPLKSSRYWTQTYAPATLKRPPGELLSEVRVVPNPLNMASEESVRFSGQENRLAFLDIPGNCTIKIYTELGELVNTIEHTDGSGDEFWNLTTRNRQIVASGVYIAVVTDNKTGQQIQRKFTVVR